MSFTDITVLTHAVLLGQACAHCLRSPTAATNLARPFSVLVWLIVLTKPATDYRMLVSRYLTT